MSLIQDFTESQGQDTATLGFLVTGQTDRTGVFSELLSNLPSTVGTLSLQKIESVDLIEGTTDLWRARVRYGLYKAKTEMKSGDMEFKFRTATRSITRTISRASRCYELDSDGETIETTPPDLRIIGWRPESRSAKGTQDIEPVESFGWTIIVPFTTATASWRRQVGALVGSVNGTTFFTYAAGEVRFDEITDNVRADGEYKMELSFSRSPNQTDVEIGDIVVPAIGGWEVVDVPETSFVEWNGMLVPRVTRVKIHAGPEQKDWSVLGSLLGV